MPKDEKLLQSLRQSLKNGSPALGSQSHMASRATAPYPMTNDGMPINPATGIPLTADEYGKVMVASRAQIHAAIDEVRGRMDILMALAAGASGIADAALQFREGPPMKLPMGIKLPDDFMLALGNFGRGVELYFSAQDSLYQADVAGLQLQLDAYETQLSNIAKEAQRLHIILPAYVPPGKAASAPSGPSGPGTPGTPVTSKDPSGSLN